MAQGIRVIVFNADEEYQPTLRSELLGIEGVKIVAEVDDAALLAIAAEQYPCDVVLIHLDPAPERLLDTAVQVAASDPDRPVFALSESTNGPLILSAMRGGIREFLTKPLDLDHLVKVLSRALQNAPDRKTQGKLYAFVGSTGGVGATTLATNLAVELADLCDAKVALVDLDFRFGQIATLLDIQPKHTIAELCDTPEMLEPALIEKVMSKHQTGVSVLAKPDSFEQAASITAAHCASVLGALQEQYEYVVVDGPNRFDPGGRIVLNMADVTFLILQLTVPSVRNVQRMLEALGGDGFNLDRLQLICNCIGANEAYGLDQQNVEKTLNRPIFWSIPGDWKSVVACTNLGQPLLTLYPRAKVRQSIRELGQKLLSADDTADPAHRPNKKDGRLFDKIFNRS